MPPKSSKRSPKATPLPSLQALALGALSQQSPRPATYHRLPYDVMWSSRASAAATGAEAQAVHDKCFSDIRTLMHTVSEMTNAVSTKRTRMVSSPAFADAFEGNFDALIKAVGDLHAFLTATKASDVADRVAYCESVKGIRLNVKNTQFAPLSRPERKWVNTFIKTTASTSADMIQVMRAFRRGDLDMDIDDEVVIGANDHGKFAKRVRTLLPAEDDDTFTFSEIMQPYIQKYGLKDYLNFIVAIHSDPNHEARQAYMETLYRVIYAALGFVRT